MHDRLVARDNALYILSEDTRLSEPVLIRRYYPLAYTGTASKFARDYGEERIGNRVDYDRLRGQYYDRDKLWYELKDGRATIPAIVEEIPLACPKVRQGIETRYRDGRWQKLLKTGWCDA